MRALLLVYLLLGVITVDGAYQRGSIVEKWDTALTIADSSLNSNLIIVSAVGGTPLHITAPADASLTFEVAPADTTCATRSCTPPMCEDPCKYSCRFTGGGVTVVTAGTIVSGSGNKNIACLSPEWGSDKPVTTLVFKLYKGDLEVDSRQSDPLLIYLEEDIVSVAPSTVNANGQEVVVTGSGFDASKKYNCAAFSASVTGPNVWVASTSTLFADLRNVSQPMTVVNTTRGTCTVAAGFSAQPSAKLTVLRESAAFNKFSGTVGVAQPLINRVSSNVLYFDSTNIVVTESWTSLSTYSGQGGGGDVVTITGAGFDSVKSYSCLYSVSGASASSVGKVLSPTQVTCVTPAWTNPDGNTIFKIMAGVSEVMSNQLGVVYFFFLRRPVWNEAGTIAANSIYVEGVNCKKNLLQFQADQGGSELRMVLSYTPLRPKPSVSWTQKHDEAPSLADVLRNTERLSKQTFLQGAMVDTPLADGRPSLTVLSHTLQLPTGTPRGKTTKSGDVINVEDNEMEPSRLDLTTVTRCNDLVDSVCGTLSWDVSRGWEGYAYELCVTARHAIVPATQVDSQVFLSRCFYVVVPKCRKCYSSGDTLHTIAASYGSSWVDLWSLNPTLSNTTEPSSADEVGFNTPNDAVYMRVMEGQQINTGVLYRIGGEDYLYTVGKRFGMTLANLMALNPDVVKSNQDVSLVGKHVCILPTSKIYDKCEAPQEQPNPVFWERILGYDEKGVAIKQWNPRYPRQPLHGIPRHGA